MDQELKTTCLHEDHIALGAKMSPFAGFDMPIQYAGIIQEHNAVRTAAGMFDVSHMGEIVVDGPDAEKFVNHIFTNDVRGLEPGHILYGMMCYPDGGTVDDLLVYKEFESGFLLVVNAANIEKDFDWILKNKEGFEVEVFNDSDSWGQIALQGPKAEDALVNLMGIEELRDLEFYTFYDLEDEDGGRVIVSRTGYTGEDGFEIYASPDNIRDIWAMLLEDGIQPCGLGCRDTLRFEAGLPLYGDELSADISPVMAGFSMFCKFDKPEFIGKEALLAQKTGGVARKVVGIELSDSAIPRAGYPVELEDGTEVGVVTTGYHSITLDKSICFALVDSAHAALGTPLWIRIRKKVFPGVTVKKRFYQTNYKK
ncbi:MAG: glycine cleavage system aminomethyltransferase GcvT [Bacteroidales bacterium]|nr:glycine cleavage system aminomethyltransferase GcvT [Bacteroidales bacterium]